MPKHLLASVLILILAVSFSSFILQSGSVQAASTDTITYLQSRILELQKQLVQLLLQLQAENTSSSSTSTASTSTAISAGDVFVNCQFTRNLSLDSQGSDVSYLKQFLSQKGYLVASNTSNTFDSDTKSALKRYQSDNNILASGFFGPVTRAKINSYSTSATSCYDGVASSASVSDTFSTSTLSDNTGSLSYITAPTANNLENPPYLKDWPYKDWSSSNYNSILTFNGLPSYWLNKPGGYKFFKFITPTGTDAMQIWVAGQTGGSPAGTDICSDQLILSDKDFGGQANAQAIYAKLNGLYDKPGQSQFAFASNCKSYKLPGGGISGCPPDVSSLFPDRNVWGEFMYDVESKHIDVDSAHSEGVEGGKTYYMMIVDNGNNCGPQRTEVSPENQKPSAFRLEIEFMGKACGTSGTCGGKGFKYDYE